MRRRGYRMTARGVFGGWGFGHHLENAKLALGEFLKSSVEFSGSFMH